ncbi:helix-turn-helix domain-containing protein, partial [Providencia rustigianii]
VYLFGVNNMGKRISKSVGLKIRTLRESHGMSGKKLSELMGISQQHQSRYENGEVNIHVDTIYLLSQIFSVEPIYFFSEFDRHNNHNEENALQKNYYTAEVVVF